MMDIRFPTFTCNEQRVGHIYVRCCRVFDLRFEHCAKSASERDQRVGRCIRVKRFKITYFGCRSGCHAQTCRFGIHDEFMHPLFFSQFIAFGREFVSVYCLIFEPAQRRHLLFRAHVLSLLDPSPLTMPRALPWMSVDEKRLVGNHRGRRRPL